MSKSKMFNMKYRIKPDKARTLKKAEAFFKAKNVELTDLKHIRP